MARKAPKTDPTLLKLRDNHLKAVELRKAGLTYEQIARACGFANRSAAYNAVTGCLKRVEKEGADDLILLEMDRMDALMASVWPKARAGDLGAVDRVLRIMERRARLMGLDAPTKTQSDITTRGGVLVVPGTLSPEEWTRMAQEQVSPGPGQLRGA